MLNKLWQEQNHSNHVYNIIKIDNLLKSHGIAGAPSASPLSGLWTHTAQDLHTKFGDTEAIVQAQVLWLSLPKTYQKHPKTKLGPAQATVEQLSNWWATVIKSVNSGRFFQLIHVNVGWAKCSEMWRGLVWSTECAPAGSLHNGGSNGTSPKRKVIWAVFFFGCLALILLLCLRRCLRNAYAYADHTFEGVCVCVPMQGHRPCKTMPQRTCLPTPSRSRLTFAYATIVPSAFCSVACHAAPCRGTSQKALNRTLLPAAAHAPRSQSAPQVPGTQVPDHWRLS